MIVAMLNLTCYISGTVSNPNIACKIDMRDQELDLDIIFKLNRSQNAAVMKQEIFLQDNNTNIKRR